MQLPLCGGEAKQEAALSSNKLTTFARVSANGVTEEQ